MTQEKGMIDISEKDETKRRAVASAQIKLSPEGYAALMDNQSPKGNVFETAKIAGIMAAKSTPQIIPLCHPLALNKIDVQFEPDDQNTSITVTAEVLCIGKTGVEMEALTAVSVSVLTIYDMMKWKDKGMVIFETKLLEKSGGKSGDFKRA